MCGWAPPLVERVEARGGDQRMQRLARAVDVGVAEHQRGQLLDHSPDLTTATVGEAGLPPRPHASVCRKAMEHEDWQALPPHTACGAFVRREMGARACGSEMTAESMRISSVSADTAAFRSPTPPSLRSDDSAIAPCADRGAVQHAAEFG
jgi:hypothetical protein